MFQLGRYQVTDSQSIAGMINPENTLDAMWHREPQKITNVMIKLLAIHRGRSLENLLNMFPVHEIDDDRDFYWELIGSSRRNIELVEARYKGAVVTDTDFGIGEGTSTFELVFAEMWFFDGETIVGEKNEAYPIRIVKEPRPEGTNFVYSCETFGVDSIPGEELVRGKRFSCEYAAVGRGLSRDVGGVRRVTPISMRGDVSTLRISHKIAGNAQNKKVAMGIPAVDGSGEKKSFPVLALYEDWLVEQEFSVYKNRAMMFGKTNRDYKGEYHNLDKSGWVIKMGSGIREQMEFSNTFYYDGEFDLEMLEQILLTLAEGKLGFSERTFILRTGERGAYGFHKAVLNTTSGWGVNLGQPGTNRIDTIKKSQSNELHSNPLEAGFQFIKYLAPNGVTVKVEVDDFYDDKERNKIRFPGSRGVAESYRYDIFYIGTPETPNIKRVAIKNQHEMRGYRWGFRNPFTGESNNKYMSTDEDSAVVTKFCQLAAVVFDPSRTAQIIPEILAA